MSIFGKIAIWITQKLNEWMARYDRLPTEEVKDTLDPKGLFFDTFAPYAIQTMSKTGVPASVTLAQAALESNWGRSAPGNNFFGIKGKGPAGTQSLWTTEVVKGKAIRVMANFRKYHTPEESFTDHAKIISEGKYLKHAMVHTESAEAFIHALQSGKYKYATDDLYESKILKLIRDHNLKRFDQLKEK